MFFFLLSRPQIRIHVSRDRVIRLALINVFIGARRGRAVVRIQGRDRVRCLLREILSVRGTLGSTVVIFVRSCAARLLGGVDREEDGNGDGSVVVPLLVHGYPRDEG